MALHIFVNLEDIEGVDRSVFVDILVDGVSAHYMGES